MQPKIYDVKPLSVLGTTVNKIEISNGTVDLDASAHFDVRVLDESGASVASRNVAIEKPEYDQWGGDDNYIVNLICTKLGLEIA